jgi:LPXTG-site transpeptidase (sortase) family protein
MVLEGDDPRTLARGVGHIPGTALPGWSGNVGFAGHRDTFFRALQNIRLGDDILVTTLQGCYRYRVVSSEIVSPDETRVLDASAVPSLTLVTCYPFYFIGSAPKRFVVHAHLVWDEMGVSSGTMGATVSNVASGSAAEEAGLRQRDVIQQGNRKPVVTANEFVTSVRAGRQPMLLLIDRGGDHLYLVVTPHA